MKQEKDEAVINWEVCHYQNEQLHELSLKYRDDKNYRDKAKNDSGALLKSLGVVLPEGIDARFIVNTDKTWYFVMPQRPRARTHVHRAGKTAGVGDVDLLNAASFFASLASVRGRTR